MRRPSGRPPSADWGALALQFEQTSETMTVDEFARQVGINYGTLKDHCAREHWMERRERFHEQALAQARKTLARELGKRYVEQSRQDLDILHRFKGELVDQMQSGKMKTGYLENAARALVEVIKMERLIMGEASDRTEVSTKSSVVKVPVFSEEDPKNHVETEAEDGGGGVADNPEALVK